MKKVLIIALFSRVFLFVGVILIAPVVFGQNLLSPLKDLPYKLTYHWDGLSYLNIAQNGYPVSGPDIVRIVFPPLYSFLIWILDIFHRNPYLNSLFLSNLFFVTGCLLFYKILSLDYSPSFCLKCLTLLAFFPTGYFFSTSYAESLYFFLFCLAFLAIRTNHSSQSAAIAGLAALTKPFGLILGPAIIVEAWRRKLGKRKIILISVVFVLVYGVYLFLNYHLFGDPFIFKKFLDQYWNKSFTFPWVSIKSTWERVLLVPDLSSHSLIIAHAEAVTATLSWIILPFMVLKYFRWSYLLYYFLSILMMTSTGFLLSLPRYLLSLPPLFIFLTIIMKNRVVFLLWLLFSGSLMLYLGTIFATGGWAF